MKKLTLSPIFFAVFGGMVIVLFFEPVSAKEYFDDFGFEHNNQASCIATYTGAGTVAGTIIGFIEGPVGAGIGGVAGAGVGQIVGGRQCPADGESKKPAKEPSREIPFGGYID